MTWFAGFKCGEARKRGFSFGVERLFLWFQEKRLKEFIERYASRFVGFKCGEARKRGFHLANTQRPKRSRILRRPVATVPYRTQRVKTVMSQISRTIE